MPGAGGCRKWLANSMRELRGCDTAGMRPFSRTLARWDLRLIGASTLAAGWLVIVAAFLYSATGAPAAAAPKSIGAAVLLTGIALTGILYAWREPAA